MPTAAARLPMELSEKLNRLTLKNRRSKSYYIVKALEIYFAEHLSKEDQRLFLANVQPTTLDIARRTGLLPGKRSNATLAREKNNLSK